MHLQQKEEQIHIPVLLQPVLDCLKPAAGDSYLDVTAGYGGHAQAILEKTSTQAHAVLVDRDEQAINALHDKFDARGAVIIHEDFLTASKQLAKDGKKFDMILADLGVSSLHLNEASRGFAFSLSGPLDMRMDKRQDLSAETVVNTWKKDDLLKILRLYGQEPKAAEIASRIVASRPITTTDQLAGIVAKAWPGAFQGSPGNQDLPGTAYCS